MSFLISLWKRLNDELTNIAQIELKMKIVQINILEPTGPSVIQLSARMAYQHVCRGFKPIMSCSLYVGMTILVWIINKTAFIKARTLVV